MAQPPTATYMAIPPPPLPEFYKKTDTKSATSTSSTSGTDSGSHKLPAMPGDGADNPWNYIKTNKATFRVPAPSPDSPTGQIPPLAVYHICRICLRPRSARYHREHPIPIDGLPPPPGICRRCRISSVDEPTAVTDVVEHKESNDLKIGIKAFVPDRDCFTNEEIRAKRARRVLGDAFWREIEPASDQKSSIYRTSRSFALEPMSPPPVREEIIYRHIHVAVPPPPLLSAPRQVVHVTSTAQDAIDAVSAKASNPAPAQYTTYRIPPPPLPEVRLPQTRKPKEVESSASVSSRASSSSRPKHRSSSHREIVSIQTNGRERSETEIRKLARDEVERYRQAERRMEAHRDPYAHGRMVEAGRVPVERRIELEKDNAEPAPWAAKYDMSCKDSGIASFKGTAKVVKKEKEVAVRRSRNSDDNARSTSAYISETVRPLDSLPSTISSDKTRWPSAAPDGRGNDQRRFNDQNRSSHRTYVVAERASTKGNANDRGAKEARYEVTEVVGERKSQPDPHTGEAPREVEIRYESKKETQLPDRVAELQEDFERQERTEAWSKETQKATSDTSKWTDREYWNDKPAAGTDVSHMSVRKTDRSPGRGRGVSTQEVEATRSRVEKLPYPGDDFATPVPMSSPYSHVSRQTRPPPPDEYRPRKPDDGEYMYVERKVQSLGRSPKSSRNYDEYEKVERYIHRTKPQSEQKDSKRSVTARIRDEDMKRRPCDASSRVRFSKKVDISPTPPGSDASSSQFRSSSQVKNQGRETESGADLIAEYERRGRQRSRASAVDDNYYHEDETRPAQAMDRDQTPRPGPGQRRRSGSTETATVPSNLGHLARCFSESPSRERLDEAARRQRLDRGFGPYAVDEKRSVSVSVEDGSSVSSDSWNRYSSYRERDGRRGVR